MSNKMKIVVWVCGLLGGLIAWHRLDLGAGISSVLVVWWMWFFGYWLAGALQRDRTSFAWAGPVIATLGGVIGMLLYGAIGSGYILIVSPPTGPLQEPSAGVALLIGGAGALAGLAGSMMLYRQKMGEHAVKD